MLPLKFNFLDENQIYKNFHYDGSLFNPLRGCGFMPIDSTPGFTRSYYC